MGGATRRQMQEQGTCLGPGDIRGGVPAQCPNLTESLHRHRPSETQWQQLRASHHEHQLPPWLPVPLYGRGEVGLGSLTRPLGAAHCWHIGQGRYAPPPRGGTRVGTVEKPGSPAQPPPSSGMTQEQPTLPHGDRKAPRAQLHRRHGQGRQWVPPLALT